MQAIKTKVGIDVSAKTLTVARRREGEDKEQEFANDAVGHRELLKWVGKGAKVCVEATGVYHLQLALMLRAAGVEVMVVNPRVAKDFARALANRSKTDRVDARTLLEYVERMEFTAWQAPSRAVLELRELGRRLSELVRTAVEEKNRLHRQEGERDQQDRGSGREGARGAAREADHDDRKGGRGGDRERSRSGRAVRDSEGNPRCGASVGD